jgi:hypothetical protein
MLIPTSEAKLFTAGERVPQTGVYECSHSAHHEASKQKLVFESGKKFPLCKICFWSVRYAHIGDCALSDMDPTSRKRNEAKIQSFSA